MPDPDAYDHDRLRHLTSRMIRDYPGLERWVEIDDVLQNALSRLGRALGTTKPESPRHFFELAVLQIRRELIDLALQYEVCAKNDMPDSAGETSRLLDLFRLGDKQARDRLIAHACERLRRLTSQMLRNYPGLRRWEQTDDVLQNAMIRLCRALEATKPESARHFYNLAALQIRRELIDLAHHYLGPQGLGAMHHTDGKGKAADDEGGALDSHPSMGDKPESFEEWTIFHEKVDLLPDEEREVFGLIWYEGLTQEQVAEILKISLRTVKRRWQSARIKLFRANSGDPPQ